MLPAAARNIELKARLSDPQAAVAIARSLAQDPPVRQHQVDTYFAAAHGRLKLREIEGRGAQLVWYARCDQAAAKSSDYRLVPVGDPAALKQALASALGITQIVEKVRHVYFYENVRIHLDEVVGLGSFLEFEAVLGPGVDDAAGRVQVEFLQSAFQLRAADLIENSYSDLLPKRSG
jgi:adenylate cyclase class 2